MHTLFHHPSIPSMLNDIKQTCSIFLTDTQFAQMINLREHSIHVLWKNKDQLGQFVFFHNNLFNTLIQLTSDNLKTFFETAKIGPTGNAESILNILYSRQMSCPVTVVAVPQVYPTYRAFPSPLPPVYQHPTPQPYVQSIPPVYHYPAPPPYSSSAPVHQHPAPSQVQSPGFFSQSSNVHHHGVSRSSFRPF